MSFTRNPFARLLEATGSPVGGNAFTYNDYLYELLADGSEERPVTEQQWEMICDMQGTRRLVYASTIKHAVENAVENAERRANKED